MNQSNHIQRTAEIARRLVILGQREKALNAYILLIHQAQNYDPKLELEAALYIFQNEGDYKIAYDSFRNLYNQGYCRDELLSIMTQAFYTPNAKTLKARYEKNCKLLEKYPYIFHRDFPHFENLPLRFYPYDDHGYLPYDIRTEQFGRYIDFSHPVVSRNFFANLDKPILAADVFSQYELEYLNDNVRKSEWVARENHIYLHYTSWEIFCSYLQVLNLRQLLKDKKFVFLIGDEISQYPIDFKARFGVDYSRYAVAPLGSREIHRLIWHTQLAAHNGGDFFNEIFDNHPNLIILHSVMLENIHNIMEQMRTALREGSELGKIDSMDGDQKKVERLLGQLRHLPNWTEQDLFMTIMLCTADMQRTDPAERIVPAIFFQPHFSNIHYGLTAHSSNVATLHSPEYEEIKKSPIFKSFKYIKTFTPIRRITTSYGATLRFMCNRAGKTDKKDGKIGVVSDVLSERLLNRSYMIDWQDQLFKDCVLVRFEDGKLNPKATFTALAAFLDIPYTESMTYCSMYGCRNAESYDGNDIGFSLDAIYRTYDEYCGIPERYYLEYFLQDLYKYCEYDLHYYDGAYMDLERAESFLEHFTIQDDHIRATLRVAIQSAVKKSATEEFDSSTIVNADEDTGVEALVEKRMAAINNKRRDIAKILLQKPQFVNQNGQFLHMMPKLQLDPALLEQPLYH